MKKLFSLLTIVFIFMGFGMSVQAEESDNSYYVFCHSENYQEDDNYRKVSEYSYNFTIPSDCKLAFYWCKYGNYYGLGTIAYKNNKIVAVRYNEDIELNYGDLVTFSQKDTYSFWGAIYDVVTMNESTFSNTEYEKDMITVKSNSISEDTTLRLVTQPNHFLQPSFDEYYYTTTNIPIFGDISTAYNWITTGEGLKDAENYSDIVNFVYDSKDVPVPRDVKVFEENERYYLSWQQTTDDLNNISSVVFNKDVTGAQMDVENGEAYPSYPKFLFEYIDPALSHKVDITDVILELKTHFNDIGVESYTVGLDLSLRNKWEKSEFEIHYSTYVHALLTIKYSYKEGLQVSVEYEEKDSDDNYVPDSDYNDYGDGSGIVDDDFNVVGGSDLFGNILGGLGLLGGSGLVGLLAQTFGFIPSEIWSIFGAGLSLLLIIGLVKLAIK